MDFDFDLSGLDSSNQSTEGSAGLTLYEYKYHNLDALDIAGMIVDRDKEDFMQMIQDDFLDQWVYELLGIIKEQGFSDEDYKKKEEEIGKEDMRKVEKAILLKTIDFLWTEH